ncbi:MucR family transcriptional regulator [Rhodovibrionaceae bacterium A322]
MQTEHSPANQQNDALLNMTAKVVSAYVSNNSVPRTDLPNVILSIHDSLRTLGTDKGRIFPGAAKQTPFVPIKKSITPNFLICLEDGKKLKMLKRHLRTAYGMTPDEYRAKWGLPSTYPMVAPNYAKQRSEFAVKIGLGKRDRT